MSQSDYVNNGIIRSWMHDRIEIIEDTLETIRAEYQVDCDELIDSLVRKGVVSYA